VAWTAKRSIMARITNTATGAAQGTPLYGVQVAYALPANPERICVYAARVRSARAPATAEFGVIFREDITLDIRVRVQELGGDIQDAEQVAEGISRAIALAVTDPAQAQIAPLIYVSATDQDPTIVAPDPEPYVTVNAALSISLSMNTEAV
jgi:hypothetical protein